MHVSNELARKSPPTVRRPEVTEEKRRKSLREFGVNREPLGTLGILIGHMPVPHIKILCIFDERMLNSIISLRFAGVWRGSQLFFSRRLRVHNGLT